MKPHLRTGILSRAQQTEEQQEGAALTSLEEHRDKLVTPQGAGLEAMCMRGLCKLYGLSSIPQPEIRHAL